MRKNSVERPFATIRQERGLTLEAAAEKLRITPRYLRGLELGHGPLSYVLACRMVRLYKCGLMDLRGPHSEKED